MIKLILLGLLAGALFSSTFVLNELMSHAGGHWFWSASLRYAFMWLLLSLIITMKHGFGRLKELTTLFCQHWQFWCVTGSIGFGVFYTGICYAADHVAGWVVAATFMFTVVTSLLVLLAFGQRFDKKFIAYAILVFIGVVLVNVSEGLRASAIQAVASTSMNDMLLLGALPALLAAFCYPIGNQLVWQVSYNSRLHTAKVRQERENIRKQNIQPLVSNTLILSSISNDLDATANLLSITGDINQPESRERPTPNNQPQSIMQSLLSRIPVIETDLLQNAFNKVWQVCTDCRWLAK